jgi:hypothetical protein
MPVEPCSPSETLTPARGRGRWHRRGVAHSVAESRQMLKTNLH